MDLLLLLLVLLGIAALYLTLNYIPIFNIFVYINSEKKIIKP